MSTPVVPNGSADVGVPDVPGISDPPGCDLVPVKSSKKNTVLF